MRISRQRQSEFFGLKFIRSIEEIAHFRIQHDIALLMAESTVMDAVNEKLRSIRHAPCALKTVLQRLLIIQAYRLSNFKGPSRKISSHLIRTNVVRSNAINRCINRRAKSFVMHSSLLHSHSKGSESFFFSMLKSIVPLVINRILNTRIIRQQKIVSATRMLKQFRK